MRKLFGYLVFAFLLLYPLTAQETSSSADKAAEEVNEQYETFSWEPVAKAKQYGVTIEKYDAVTEIWSDYKDVKTKETSLEVLFTPGTYRVSICTYNLIGRKSKGSDWVIFKILEENIPYLNERFLPKSKIWNAPVLFLNQKNSEAGVLPEDSDAVNYITAPEGFGENTILIKGRNIFSPKTEFYLIPKEENSEGGRPFINYCDDRKEQKLKVINRNSKDYSVVVSYDSSLLLAGYYSLEVRNPGDNRDSIELLVLNDTGIQLAPEKGFVIDEHYKVNTFSNKNFGVYEFSVKGKGFNSNTNFYLEPANGTYPYPFESVIQRQNVPLEMTGVYKQGGGNAQITMTCQIDELRTGYYNLIASNWDGTVSKFLCLVKKPFENDYTKKVKKLKTKYNKKTEYVDVTLQDEKFDLSKTYTLVSEYDASIDSNKKVQLSLSPSGKKLTGIIEPDKLTIAKYALIIEDASSYNVIYCEIDNRLKISENKMSDSVVAKTFLRPADREGAVTLDTDDTAAVVYLDNEIEMKKHLPPLFTNMHFNMTFLNDSSTYLDVEFDILNFRFVSLLGGYEYRAVGSDTGHVIFSDVKFSLPNNYFEPYLSAGIGQKLQFPEQGITGYQDVLGMLTDTNQTYAFAQGGVVLFTIMDVRYNLILNDLFTSPYFTESISFGFSFPLRAYKFKRNVLTQAAQITKPGLLDASQTVEQERKGKGKTIIPVDKVEIFKSQSVTGFEGFKYLEEVQIDRSVQFIEENAFADCPVLTNVSFMTNYAEEIPLTIKTNAFANDTQIISIHLPSRTSVIQAGAFAGWTNGQLIILDWTEDTTQERELSGLMDCSATVLYKDGTLFHGSYNSPLDNAHNWCEINNLKMENVSVHKEGNYILGVALKGYGASWYKSELYTWINQDSPQEVIDYIKSGDRIKFKVQGDGNSYNFILTTQDGGYFYYKFKTKEDKLTEIEIPYKKLKKYSYSSQKKLEVENIKMCSIVPMFKNEWNDVTFFDFEVTDK